SNGIVPMHSMAKTFLTAASFRRAIQTHLRPHLAAFPDQDPLSGVDLPRFSDLKLLRESWPAATLKELGSPEKLSASIGVDPSVQPVTTFSGGYGAAKSRLTHFLKTGLRRYSEMRNKPEENASSGLSVYLHFGHMSSHEIFLR